MKSETESEILLQVNDLHAGYGGPQVIQGVSLRVNQGRITALLGANGAGKTTLLRAISGVIRSSGVMTLQSKSMTGQTPEQIARLGVAHVPEGRGTFGELTVEENLLVGAFANVGKRESKETMDRIFDWFPRLAERRRQQAGSLSGGEQQMLAIGRALMGKPQILLLDEPTFGLAPKVAMEVIQVVRKLQSEMRMGVLLVEQNLTLALKVADDGYVLANGRVAAAGAAVDLRDDMVVRAAYFGES